ncbi:sporulation protein [Dactylosporangium sp. AC04546]|uniref:sporulation protein n=1 Tax=Dactylosporangium sp. AC04546 TaxID=2862460 RepID=UPI002E7C4D96|nr:sporulation protein [Dactylosporangium sp. AC04546]WVK86763.1 sporulation protein [Dactylosporangium sp. AC04546]
MAPGDVHLRSGKRPVDVAHVVVFVETGDGLPIMRHQVAGRCTLPAGRARAIPFLLPVPWETPVTWPEHPVVLVVRTEVAFAGGAVSCWTAPFQVHPSLGHRRLLEALRSGGFRLERVDLVEESLPEVRRSMSFVQRMTFRHCTGREGGMRVALVANPVGVDVVSATAAGRRHALVRHDCGTLHVAELLGAWPDRA